MKVALKVLFHVNRGEEEIQTEMTMKIMDREIRNFILVKLKKNLIIKMIRNI